MGSNGNHNVRLTDGNSEPPEGVLMPMPEDPVFSQLMSTVDLKTVNFTRTFSAAHRIQHHPGKCKRIHGHNYHASVGISADHLNDMGMVVEWGAIKELIDQMDHTLIVATDDPLTGVLADAAVRGILDYDSAEWVYYVDVPPTTESLAAHLAERIVDTVRSENSMATYISVEVTLQETDSIIATATMHYDQEIDRMQADAESDNLLRSSLLPGM